MPNNKINYPFYVHPMGHKRSMQIIKEAKAEIKKMELHRPITPFASKKVENEFHVPNISRPSSSSSSKSIKYEHEEDSTLSARKTPTASPKAKQKDTTDLKLEPLVTKSVLTLRKPTTSHTKSISQTDIVFPPIANEEKIRGNVMNVDKQTNHETSLCPVDNCLTDAEKNVPNETDRNMEFLKLNISSPTADRNGSVTIERNASEELSQELRHILFVLDRSVKTGRTKYEDEHIIVICKLHNLLKDNDAFQSNHPQRISLLKTLFKFLDSNLPVLSAHTIRLLLEMKVRDKNLGCVFRLLLRLMTSQKVNLEDYELYGPFFEAIREISFENNKEAVLYGASIIKFLTIKAKLGDKYVDQCLNILLQHLRKLNDMELDEEEKCDEAYMDLNKEIYTILHYLLEKDQVSKELSSLENFTQMLKGLGLLYKNCEVTEIILRLIGKIIDREDEYEIFENCPENLLMILPRILEIHMHRIGIMLQATFIIGNLLLVNNEIILIFFKQHNLHKTLIRILDEYAKEHIQAKRTLSNKFTSAHGESSGDYDWRIDVSEVISKALSVFANSCLNTEAGCFLAQEEEIIFHLLNIIGAYLKHETYCGTNLSIESFLVVIGNISYYLTAESEASLKIARRVIPLFHDSFSFEIRRSSANIIQNLTRSPDVRKYIQEYKLLPAFVQLLSETDHEFSMSAYGIIMNLLLDENNHAIFYQEEGVNKILHKLHLCADRDWKTSALLLQILWNYCKCIKEDYIPISTNEAKHLTKFLIYSTSKEGDFQNKNSDFYLTWKNDYCPVANKLLNVLQSKSTLPT